MLKHRQITLGRLGNFNAFLSSKLLYQHESTDAVTLQVYSVPNLERIPFSKAIKGDYTAAKVGQSFGPSWSTHWFRVQIEVPRGDQWAKQIIHFIWDSDSEALIWDSNGVPLQGLTGGNGCDRRAEFELTNASTEGQVFSLYVEMACNGMFGVGRDGQINPPDPNRFFTLKTAKIAVFDREAFDFYMDFKIIYEMAKHLPEESQRGRQALYVANDMINKFNTTDRTTWSTARAIGRRFLSQRNGDSQHLLYAVGHCHIDVAWLWPYDETKRKAARSFATQILYMDKYPKYRFAQSQAQLYDWVKQLYPELYEKLKAKVHSGQFIPTGGSWVEMCGILPSGESFVRQFLHGQRFFEREFGRKCTEFWLPDSFGYSGQLPQIMRGAGIDSFLTQKLSWNLINKFPHSTFQWEGIDGSQVLTHFPPADTYNASVEVEQLLFNVSNFKDKERSNISLMLYGHGDGGGGPNIDMLERIERLSGNPQPSTSIDDSSVAMMGVDGLPRMQHTTPVHFFDACKELAVDTPLLTYVGELYLEFHRGTYTSQAHTKRGNRKNEFLLRDTDLFLAINRNFQVADEMERLWKLLLTNQFHDVLPGSSIGMVYKDVALQHAEIERECNAIIEATLSNNSDSKNAFWNTLPWQRTEIVTTKDQLAIISVPSIGYAEASQAKEERPDGVGPVVISEDSELRIVVENDFIRLTISKSTGQVIELFDKRADRIAVANGNTFALYDDVPLFWDAWDVEVYHLEKYSLINSEAESSNSATRSSAVVRVVENDPIRATIAVDMTLTATSSLRQLIRVSCLNARIDFDTEVEWLAESRKMLKVLFPTTIRSSSATATYEIQYGHLTRPTHYNTSWDVARFEVLAHKWADLSEYGYGVALLNDCKYGHSIHNGTISLSLLRAPKAPDDECDLGHHRFSYALYPHTDSLQKANVIRESYNFNVPLRNAPTPTALGASHSYFSVDSTRGAGVILEVVKPAEERDGLVLRLYESFGGHANNVSVNVSPVIAQHVESVSRCNLLEEEGPQQGALTWDKERGVISGVSFGPFQILSLKLRTSQ